MRRSGIARRQMACFGFPWGPGYEEMVGLNQQMVIWRRYVNLPPLDLISIGGMYRFQRSLAAQDIRQITYEICRNVQDHKNGRVQIGR